MHFHVDQMTDGKKATIVEVEFVLDNGDFWFGAGSSRRAHGDDFDYDLGELIAGTRALDNLVNHSSRGLKVAVKKRIAALEN
jgi:hypothetical protein